MLVSEIKISQFHIWAYMISIPQYMLNLFTEIKIIILFTAWSYNKNKNLICKYITRRIDYFKRFEFIWIDLTIFLSKFMDHLATI